MYEKPHADLLRSEITPVLSENKDKLKTILNYPENDEVVFRDIKCGDIPVCIVFIDGMAASQQLADFVIRASQLTDEIPETSERTDFFIECALQTAQCSTEKNISSIVGMILSGMAAVLVEHADTAIMLDVRGYEKRKINTTVKERVVVGPQEGFVEDLRSNLTLIHRYTQTAELICEKKEVGTRIPLRIALVYMKGVTDRRALDRVKSKIMGIDTPVVHGAGELMQLIEDNPWSLFPQMLMTERPDRAAAALADGQFVILADKSPYALIAPCSVFALLQAPDDAHSRWQYGSYSRIIRIIGLFLAVFLPGIYVALTVFHSHVIPLSLLTAIARTRASVPFPVLFEIIAMELSFFMINEANMRIPSQIGSFIGIIGALVLGQVAVEASLISPILIILIAVSGLGCYAMPDYSISVSLIILRLSMVAIGAFFGIYGIVIGGFAILCQLCGMHSFGIGYLAPVAPHMRHNPDVLLRLPLFMQKLPLFTVQKGSWIRRRGRKN